MKSMYMPTIKRVDADKLAMAWNVDTTIANTAENWRCGDNGLRLPRIATCCAVL